MAHGAVRSRFAPWIGHESSARGFATSSGKSSRICGVRNWTEHARLLRLTATPATLQNPRNEQIERLVVPSEDGAKQNGDVSSKRPITQIFEIEAYLIREYDFIVAANRVVG